jgi:glucose/arabinose dehydrogenase
MRILLVVFVIVVIFLIFNFSNQIFEPTESFVNEGVSKNDGVVEIVAENLEIPWSIAFLPNGEMLVSERGGRLLKIGEDEKSVEIEGVKHFGEGGLLGIALHPDFEENNYIYLYLTSEGEGETINRVERFVLDVESLTLSERFEIIGDIPGARFHNGGKIVFGPDGLLYISTGDAGNGELSQDVGSLAGKILRLKDDGLVPSDNPFENEVYTYGHRNSQGLVWDDKGRMWSTEHGRSGALSGLDEVNLIVKGANYGWGLIQGDEIGEGMRTPELNSGPDETWAPAGVTYYDGRLFFAGLRGSTLYEVEIGNEVVMKSAHFREEFGRLRDVVLGPDESLYVTTSNRDGRGDVRAGDDKILRIDVAQFG